MADRIRKLTATTPDGIYTRRTDRDYSHVVTYGTYATWHLNLVNAKKAVAKHVRYIARWAPEGESGATIHLVDGADVTAALKGAL